MINWALFLSYLLSIIIMIGLPIVLAIMITRYFKVSWMFVLMGVLTYAIYRGLWTLIQSGFNSGALPVPPSTWPPLAQVAILSLIAVIIEQGLVWVGFILLRKMTKHYGAALSMGVGHGGMQFIENAVVGIIVPLWPILTYNGAAEIAKGVPTNSVSQMLSSIAQFWTQPFYMGLLPGFQQLIAFSLQIVLSILIWKAVVNRNGLWLLLVLVYQTVYYLLVTFIGTLGLPSYVTIGVLLLFFLINAYLIYQFTTDEVEYEDEEEDEDEEGESDDEDEAEDEEEEEGDELDEGEDSVDDDTDTDDADSTSSAEDPESKPED